MSTRKRKCASAPEQRQKRNRSVSSSTSNFDFGPQVIMNQQGGGNFPSRDEIRACARILCALNGLPYTTFNSAKKALRDRHNSTQFNEMCEKCRLKWLGEITPPAFRKDYQWWLENNFNVEVPGTSSAHAPHQ